MKNIRPIPNSVQLFIEIKRLIEAVYTDNTEQFDIFENDMFILFDPVDGIEEEEDEEEECASNDACHEVIDPEVMEPENEYEGLINEAIEAAGDEDDDFDEDDGHDCGDDCGEEHNPFNVFMPFDSNFFKKMQPSSGSIDPFDLMNSDDEEDEETPNFVHKPTGLKLWWKLGDDMIYSNMPIRYRNLSNIVNQCVASLGRMTEKFIVRYQYWGEDGDAKM